MSGKNLFNLVVPGVYKHKLFKTSHVTGERKVRLIFLLSGQVISFSMDFEVAVRTQWFCMLEPLMCDLYSF